MPSRKPKTPAWARRVLGSAAVLVGIAGGGPAAGDTSDLVSKDRLRVCADPANLPLSDRDGGGFENAIAELLAAKLGRTVQYTWYPQATGFVRQTLAKGLCDLIIGYPQGDELVLNTNAYYTSAYVLVVQADSDLADVTSLADPRLKGRRIGVVVGTPPATHLARRGLLPTTRGYNLNVDTRFEHPNQEMLEDLLAGSLDAAVMWGPIGGPLARAHGDRLVVKPLIAETGGPRLFYRITMGVRQGEQRWKRELNAVLRRNQDGINAILIDAGVPLLDERGEKQIGG
jgi:quinoprotein dehydrogenase-associated probable ABC transporter substrate-binding protein